MKVGNGQFGSAKNRIGNSFCFTVIFFGADDSRPCQVDDPDTDSKLSVVVEDKQTESQQHEVRNIHTYMSHITCPFPL